MGDGSEPVSERDDDPAAEALQRRLRDAEELARRLEATLESLTDALYTVDLDWRFTYVNERAAELLGRAPDDLIGTVLWDEFPDAAEGAIHTAYHRVMATGEIEEFDEAHYGALDAWYRVVLNPSDRGLSVYFHDITDARAAREELRASEAELARQAALLDEATDAIIVRDLDHRITFWNRSAARIYGWSSEEAVGVDIRDLIHDNRARFERAHAAVLRHGAWTGELVLRRNDGDHVIVDSRWTLLRDEEDRPTAVLAIHTDVTEQRRMELHLARAQRLESLGTLAGGVAHDLNNVLSPILLAAEMLRAEEPDPDRARLIDIIVDGARRGGRMVAQVLSFARGVDGERAEVDVDAMLDGVGAIVRETFPKNITLHIRPTEPAAVIMGDQTQLQQVFLNLAVNARDAMPDGGTLTISATTVRLEEHDLVAAEGAAPGEYVAIAVEDQGHGMAPDVLDRVFDPFFTTKEQGAGTGLGLSTAAGIVRSHGGFVRAYSEPGRGSRFHVYLPTWSGPAGHDDTAAPDERLAPAADDDAGPSRSATILVVDDEPPIRTMTRRTLEAAGYDVIEAGNGADAVAAMVRADGAVDLAIVDMMMPVMDGPATVHALRSLSPTLRVIAASGLPDGRTERVLAAGIRHFLPKPFTVGRLLDVVAAALDDEAGPAPEG